MMSKDFLQGLTVVDFSHRLPGPLASYVLCNLGAKVIKVEDQIFKDPFDSGLFSSMDPSFETWYRELNQKKDIRRLDYKSANAKSEVLKLLESADIVLLGTPPKVRNNLGLTPEHWQKLSGARVFVELKAARQGLESMHDVNALALSGLLALYLEDRNESLVHPPFMPFAGITFGHKVATELLAAYYKAVKQNSQIFFESFLMDATEEIYSPFWCQELKDKKAKRFLHNGKFPCYNIYRLKDGNYVALAAVEEKFWIQFCEVFNLKLKTEDRFHFQDQSIFNQLVQLFSLWDKKSLLEKIAGQDLCLTLC